MEKIRRYFYPALMIRGSNVVNNLFHWLLKHLRCKRGLGKILVQRSTQTGQQGFCGMASPFTMLENLA
ncbi:hypothetical protein T4D_1449 [Trichinella pseudospiralis]|uniref:Uncharacterized protein n=1 Tax=Trichinella pseudospiralis TaxID=6337 RepID=A0A0V1FKN5_TRIPS|nr:hypothetical protein T4D_1449 [Trichinella pseudospiralis]